MILSVTLMVIAQLCIFLYVGGYRFVSKREYFSNDTILTRISIFFVKRALTNYWARWPLPLPF